MNSRESETHTQTHTLWHSFARSADRWPHCTALIDAADGRAITYAELAAAALGVASTLEQREVKRGDVVPVVSGRSVRAIAAYLGVLNRGATCLPVDPDFPAPRIDAMLSDASVGFYLSGSPAVNLPGLEPVALATVLDQDGLTEVVDAERVLTPETEDPNPPAAWVMYTSGSTGRPKGVLMPHAGILRLFGPVPFGPFDDSTVMLHASAVTFDAALFELFGALSVGGTCVVYPPAGIPEPKELARVIEDFGVNTAFLTTSLFHQIAATAPGCFSGLDRLVVGGEALSMPRCQRVYQQCPLLTIINGYGPTENTVFTTAYVVPRNGSDQQEMSIGQPLPDTQVALDSATGPQCGVSRSRGELLAAGVGVALGYLGQPEETARRFVVIDHCRYYRTGDLVRLGADGNYYFEGRADQQMKVRGHRVEPGDLESHLLSHPAVADAKVLVKPDYQGEKQLVAYWVAADVRDLESGSVDHSGVDPAEQLRAHLAGRVPRALVPSAFVSLGEFPLTVSGKLDQQRLPDPYSHRSPTAQAPAGDDMASDDMRGLVASAWQKYLPAGSAPDDEQNFFDAGGTSLQTLSVAEDLSRALGREVDVTRLFEFPTVAQLSGYLDGLVADSAQGPAPAAGGRAAAARAARAARRSRRQPQS